MKQKLHTKTINRDFYSTLSERLVTLSKIKQVRIKLLFMALLFSTLSLNGQGPGQTCTPSNPTYCNSPCSVICDIINDTDCDLNFIWGYQGNSCSDREYSAGIVEAYNTNKNPPMPWQGPCMSFCDGPCECPTMFRVIDPITSQPVHPWRGAIFNCCWSLTYNNIFVCETDPVHVTVSVVAGCVIFNFHY